MDCKADGLIARELGNDELEIGLGVRNSIFPAITADDWEKEKEKTAAIAYDGAQAVGFIPLYLRPALLSEGVVITGAFENAVGARSDCRGKGVGSAMIGAARSFLAGRADALMVYRGGERTAGYNFYRKTGHIDLLYMREHSCGVSAGTVDRNVHISANTKDIIGMQHQLIEVFNSTYGSYGGFPPRVEGYWQKAFNSPIFACWPNEFYFIYSLDNGHRPGNEKINAYMIASRKFSKQGEVADKKLLILEMASKDGDFGCMSRILSAASSLSASLGLEGLKIVCGDYNPFLQLLERMSFEVKPRSIHIMGSVINAEKFYNSVWKNRIGIPGVKLDVWTPGCEFTMLEQTENTSRSVMLEMKDDTLELWLMGRADFKARVREGTISVINGNEAIIDEIAKAIPLNRWEYFQLDYT